MEIAQNNSDPGNISRYERKSEQAAEERVKLLVDRLNISIGQKAKRLCTSFTSSRFSSPCYARFLIEDPTLPQHRVDPFFPSNRENHYFCAVINDRVSSSYLRISLDSLFRPTSIPTSSAREIAPRNLSRQFQPFSPSRIEDSKRARVFSTVRTSAVSPSSSHTYRAFVANCTASLTIYPPTGIK